MLRESKVIEAIGNYLTLQYSAIEQQVKQNIQIEDKSHIIRVLEIFTLSITKNKVNQIYAAKTLMAPIQKYVKICLI